MNDSHDSAEAESLGRFRPWTTARRDTESNSHPTTSVKTDGGNWAMSVNLRVSRAVAVLVVLLHFSQCSRPRQIPTAQVPETPPTPNVRFSLASRAPFVGSSEIKNEFGATLFVACESILTERDIVSARAERSPMGDTVIAVTLSDDGGNRLQRVTESHIDETLVILLDGKVIMTATIKDPISTQLQITGRFTPEGAEEIARSLRGSR